VKKNRTKGARREKQPLPANIEAKSCPQRNPERPLMEGEAVRCHQEQTARRKKKKRKVSQLEGAAEQALSEERGNKKKSGLEQVSGGSRTGIYLHDLGERRISL